MRTARSVVLFALAVSACSSSTRDDDSYDPEQQRYSSVSSSSSSSGSGGSSLSGWSGAVSSSSSSTGGLSGEGSSGTSSSGGVAAPSTISLTGACDASTVVELDDGALVIADDEDQVLRFYAPTQGTAPRAQVDVTHQLGLTDTSGGVFREVDIEGSTRVGNRVYWLGSHGNSSTGSNRPNRRRLFVTEVSGSGANANAVVLGTPYEDLRDDLVDWDNNDGHGLGESALGFEDAIDQEPERDDGFNLEGLSMTPDGGAALLGMRAPVVDGMALVITLNNLEPLLTGGGTAQFGALYQLDLGGRGVRSMECAANGCIIVAGPADGAEDFRLYTWSGNASDAPVERNADLTGMHPEGIVAVPPGPFTETTRIRLISDDGDVLVAGTPCKELPGSAGKSFRLHELALGAAVP
ncbi:MAG: DUF3616 domain-containing protein [Myxococcota bacterium]